MKILSANTDKELNLLKQLIIGNTIIINNIDDYILSEDDIILIKKDLLVSFYTRTKQVFNNIEVIFFNWSNQIWDFLCQNDFPKNNMWDKLIIHLDDFFTIKQKISNKYLKKNIEDIIFFYFDSTISDYNNIGLKLKNYPKNIFPISKFLKVRNDL